MVVLGKTGAGKSSFANTVLGTRSFLDVFSGESVSMHAQISTRQRFGKKLVVCDTPGLFDTRFGNENARKEVSWCMVLCQPGPHVFLIVVRCDVRFSQEECDVVDILQDLCGNGIYKYSVVIFTHKDQLEPVGEKEESLLRKLPTRFQELLRNVKNRYIFINNRLPYDMNEQVVRKLLHHICDIYNSNKPIIYKNPNLLECTLKERFEYDLDKDRNRSQDSKCSIL